MAKRINKPVVAVLTIGLMLVLMAVGVLLVKAIPSRDVTPIVEKAKEAFERQDFQGAITLYQTAYGRSRDIQWLVEIGKVAQEMGEAGQAFQAWQTAIVQDPSYTDARRHFVALWIDLIELNDWRAPTDAASRVYEYANSLLTTEPDDFNGRFARGIASLTLRVDKPELATQGLEDLNKALAMRPNDERVLTVLGQFYLDTKKPDEARKLYETVIREQKDDPVGYLMLGRFLMGQNELDAAIAQLNKAVHLSNNSAKALVILAQAYQMKKDLAKADELLVAAMRNDPENFEACFGRALLLLSMSKPKESLAIADEWLAKPRITRGFRANRYRSQRARILLQAASASVVMASPKGDQTKPDEQYLKQAETYLAEVENEMGKDIPQALMVRADLCRLRGQNVQAVKLLEQADTAFGMRNPDVKLRLADLYRIEGNVGAARQALVALTQLAPSYARAYYLQAAIAWQLNNHSEALSFLDQGLRLDPQNKEMLQLKLLVLQAMDRSPREQDRIKHMLGDTGSSVNDKLRQVQSKFAEDRPEEADALLREILAVEPAHPIALRIILQRLIQDDKTTEARQFLDKAKAAGDNPQIRDMEFLFMANLSPEERDAKILDMIKAEPDVAVRSTQLYTYYLSRRQIDEAKAAADALEAIEPGSDRVLRMQFSLALARGDWEQALKYAETAGQRDLDGAEGGFMRAQIALRQSDWTKAQAELEQALTRYPTHTTGWVWLAEACMHAGQLDRAKDVLLNKALQINPTKGEAYRNLAIIAERQDDQAAYRANLEKAIQYLPNDPWVVQRGVALREQDNPEAMIAVRKKILEKSPDDIDNLVRLALLHERQKQYKEAGDLLARAASLAPKNLQIVWTLVTFQQRRGDQERAEKIMTDFEQTADGEEKAAANLLLGELYLQQGKPDKAEQAYNVAAKISTNPQIKVQLAQFYRTTGRIQQAGDALRQAIQAADKDPKLQAQYRQKLVELLLQSHRLDDASAEIEAYAKRFPDSPTYLLMRGTLLMMQGQTAASLDTLTQFLQKDADNPIGLFHRGVLYLATNNLTKAIEDLRAAKSASPAGFNFEHRLALAQAFELSKQPDLAVTEIKDILQNYPVADFPQTGAVAKYLAGLYQRLKRVQDFEALVHTFIAQTPDDWSWPLELGRFSEASGNLTKAVEAYGLAAKASEYNPQAVDSYLRVLLAGKQYDQVVSYVEKQIPEQMRGGPARSRLAEAYFRKGQKDRARTLYKQALQEVSGSYVLSVMVLRNIAQVYPPQDRILMLQEQLAANPEDVATKYLLAVVLTEGAQYDQAIPLSDQLLAAAKTDQDKVLLLRQRGSMFYQANRFQEAAKTFEQLLELAPTDADTLNNLAYVFAEHLSRPAEALPYAKRAVELNPRSADMLDTLGWVQHLAGQTETALGTLVSALQIAPNNIAARYHTGMVYKKKADLEQAKSQFEQAQAQISENPNDTLSRMFQERVAKELTELAGPGSNVVGK